MDVGDCRLRSLTSSTVSSVMLRFPGIRFRGIFGSFSVLIEKLRRDQDWVSRFALFYHNICSLRFARSPSSFLSISKFILKRLVQFSKVAEPFYHPPAQPSLLHKHVVLREWFLERVDRLFAEWHPDVDLRRRHQVRGEYSHAADGFAVSWLGWRW